MSTRRSSYLKNNYALPVILLLFFAGSCVSNEVWNIKKEDLFARLSASEYDFLKTLDLKNKNLSDVLLLGPGAAYYMSRIYASLGMTDPAHKLLVIGFNREKEMWKESSGVLLLDLLLGLGRNAECEKYARECIRIALDPDNADRAKRSLLKALFRQKKDKELLKKMPELFPGDMAAADPELLLYKAVACSRTGTEDAYGYFVSLYLARPDRWIRTDAEAHLSAAGSNALSDPLLAKLILARSSLDAGSKAEGYGLLEEACMLVNPKIVTSAKVISMIAEDIALYRLTEKEYAKGISFLIDFTKKLDGNQRLTPLEMLGRLYRRASKYAEAASALNEVAAKTGDRDQKDRALWYRLASLKEAGAGDFLTELAAAGASWYDPEYFDDILEETVNALVSDRRWQDLRILFDRLAGRESKQIRSQLAYILGRAVSLGLLKTPDKNADSLRFFETATTADNANYYCFLASVIAGKLPPVFITKDIPDTAATPQPVKTDIDGFVKGFFDFGLINEGMAVLKSRVSELSDEALFYSMQRLEEAGFYKDNIRIANKSAYVKLYKIKEDTLKRQYPIEYTMYVTEFARRDNVDEHVLYALIREESAFDRTIVSRTGAVGLSQLMPETAKDTAALLGLDDYDLTDPRTNISIGSSHFARLLRYFDNKMKALVAYNAGLGRVREWSKLYPDLPFDLFVETIPFYETRDYVRKVISSAFVYGYVYYNLPLAQIAESFYPGLARK